MHSKQTISDVNCKATTELQPNGDDHDRPFRKLVYNTILSQANTSYVTNYSQQC